MAISPTVSPCRIVPSHFSRPRGSVRKESSSPSTTIQNSVTSSPADASVSPATNGRMQISPAMAASCSASKPSQNRTDFNQATTRSASAVEVGMWNLKKMLAHERQCIVDRIESEWNDFIPPEKGKKVEVSLTSTPKIDERRPKDVTFQPFKNNTPSVDPGASGKCSNR